MLTEELIKEFPEHKNSITALLNEDALFKEVAEDYILCKNELSKFTKSGKTKLIFQYSETLENLKEEIFLMLQYN